VRNLEIDGVKVLGSECMKTVRVLDDIGIRFAGTPGEREAALWIEQRLRALSLQNVQLDEFSCLTFSYQDCQLLISSAKGWREIRALPVAHSPSTSNEGCKAPFVCLEKVPSQVQKCREAIAGRAVLIVSSELFDWSRFQMVMRGKPALVLVVDDRFPNNRTVAVGLPRHWIKVVSCPMVNISHHSAWNLVREGCDSVLLKLQTTVSSAVSQNVIGEIRGKGLSREVIIVSGHHDSVINNTGADDNATGVASVLELARVFSKVARRPERTIRFISFGAEEQLSEGALHYVLSAPDRNKISFVLNTDAIGGWLGKNVMYWTGPVAVRRFLRDLNRKTGFPAHLLGELSPFSDHFPFNLAGIPSVWCHRPTYQLARHYHHSSLETPEVISPEVLQSTIEQQAVLLERLANAVPLPFQSRIPEPQMKVIKNMAREWCGMDCLPERT
jgi:aminopeptidase YwaD